MHAIASSGLLFGTVFSRNPYDVGAELRDLDITGSSTNFELYADQGALDVHGKAEPMLGAMKALGGLLGGRPEVTMMTPVAAKGLDLG